MRSKRATDADSEEAVPINVLFRRNGLGDCANTIGIDVGPKGKLNENAVDGIIIIESFHDGNDLLDRSSLGECDMLEMNTNFLGGFCLHADIDGRVRTVTSLNDGESGLEARILLLKSNNLIRNRLTD